MDNGDKLTKKERKELRRDEEQVKINQEKIKRTFIKWGIIISSALVIILGGWFVIAESNKPLPGKAVADLGRGHVPTTKRVKYNSSPPTSGEHYADWTRAGIYTTAFQDEYLVHSLEHGYVIVSYNCMKQNSKLKTQNVGTQSAELTDGEWGTKECKDLVKQLSDAATKERLWKLIVIPRPSLETTIALTAWDRIDAFNPLKHSKLNEKEKERITRFIEAFRDKGPEQTME